MILKLLVVNHTTLDKMSYASSLFNNVLPILRKNEKMNIFWFLSTNEKITEENKNELTIIKIDQFKNAIEVLQNVKPELVYLLAGYSIVDYSFLIACKHLNIPTIGGELNSANFQTDNNKKFLINYFFDFFKNDPNEVDSKKMSKGFQYLKKHLFLLRTKKAMGVSFLENMKDFFEFMKHLFQHPKNNDIEIAHPKFQCDLNFVESPSLCEKLIKAGWDKTKLTAVGNPSYDEIIKNSLEIKNQNDLDINKNKILFLTMNFIGANRKKTLEQISILLKEIKKNDKLEITIKIHPNQESISEYSHIIKELNLDVKILQKEKISDIIHDYDTVISFTSSTASLIAVLNYKPVIIWNIFDVVEDILVKWKLAVECKNISKVIDAVEKVKSMDLSKNIQRFKKDYLYNTHGNSAQRIADAILALKK